MKRKAKTPVRSKRRCVSAGGDCVPEPGPDLSTDAQPDSDRVSDSPEPMRHLTLWRHSQNLLKFLDEDRSRQKFCDVSVSVGGTIYWAHKVVLAYGSSYFHAELSKNPAMSHVTLDHVEDSVFQHLLDFLYTSECGVTDAVFPALIEAARFLDMMDILKMLCKEGEVCPPVVAEAGTTAFPPGQATMSVSPIGETLVGSPPEQASLACSENSVNNHLVESHRDLRDGTSTNRGRGTGQRTPLTRRSARTRRTPSKYMGADVEFFVNTPEEKQTHNSSPSEQRQTRVEAEDVVSENQTSTPDLTEILKPAPGDDREDEEDEGEDGGDLSEDAAVQRMTADICVESQQGPVTEGIGAEGDEDMEAQGPRAGSSNKSPVYPEGLAPVIVQSSSKKILMCPKCDKRFDRAAKYVSHTRVHTGEKPFQCDICFQRYSTKSNLTVHRKKHAGGAPFKKKEHKCPFCNKLHASRKTLAKHVRRFHPDNIQEFLIKRKKKSEGWKCAICLKTFTRRPHLQEHMILHTQDRPFKCTFCDEYFKSRFARLKHQEKYHLGPFPCEICGRQFNDTGNRKRHMECTHGGKRKWTCFICGKSVRERTTLKEHMRIHSGEKPHLCSICGQSFRHGSSYRLHLRVHHDDKRYECDECGKTFIRHDHLTKHQKIHSGEKAHQCEECGKCFRRHDHLSVHYRSVHLGEKIWQKYKTAVHQCEVCKKEFKGKSSLEMHFRTHSGEKPHKCPECHLTFRIKKTLTKHMVIHSDARPFNCAHCSATFKRKDKLKYHVDHVHSMRTPCVAALGQDKATIVPFQEASKAYHAEPKSTHQSPAPPLPPPPPPPAMDGSVSSVSLQVTAGPQGEVHAAGGPSLPSQTHSVGTMQAQGQQQNPGYQATADLAFLEKYTLTPQPTNIAHPVRPDQMLDPRDQSYLGTFLGLDSSSPVQGAEHNH